MVGDAQTQVEGEKQPPGRASRSKSKPLRPDPGPLGITGFLLALHLDKPHPKWPTLESISPGARHCDTPFQVNSAGIRAGCATTASG